jgi:hypothetical protein
MSEYQIEKQEKALRMVMERMLPDFVKKCREPDEPLIIHQDAFAVDYNEYELLGMAIKFAGLYARNLLRGNEAHRVRYRIDARNLNLAQTVHNVARNSSRHRKRSIRTK